jgi:hypothetical protein
MDGLQIKCCDIPNPGSKCIPTDQWELALQCDNLAEIETPMNCSYRRQIGIANSTTTPESFEILKAYIDLGFSINSVAKPLSLNFGSNLNASSVTVYDWNMASPETWKQQGTTNDEFNVAPRTKLEIFQISGTCGVYEVKASRFMKVETIDYGKGDVHRYNYYSQF